MSAIEKTPVCETRRRDPDGQKDTLLKIQQVHGHHSRLSYKEKRIDSFLRGCQLPRRLPFAKQKKEAKMVEKMKKDGVIENSASPWSSQVVLVRRKTDQLAFV